MVKSQNHHFVESLYFTHTDITHLNSTSVSEKYPMQQFVALECSPGGELNGVKGHDSALQGNTGPGTNWECSERGISANNPQHWWHN